MVFRPIKPNQIEISKQAINLKYRLSKFRPTTEAMVAEHIEALLCQ